jgi:iron complex transport system substrate-binding protein
MEEKLRIISLAPSVTETTFALNRQHLLVGTTDFCNFPDEARRWPKIGGFATPDLEAIIRIKPDVVVATDLHNADKLDLIRQQGIRVERVTAQKLTDSPKTIRQTGQILNCEPEAGRLAQTVESGLNCLFELAEKVPKIRVCYFCTFEPCCSWKKKCQTNLLIKLAGGTHIPVDPERMAESIAESDPEIIIVPKTSYSNEWKTLGGLLQEDEILRNLKAVRENKVYFLDGELLSRPGPRAVEGFVNLLRIIHPELEPGIERQHEETGEMIKKTVGMECWKAITNNIPKSQ